jgi:hypothetical protein
MKILALILFVLIGSMSTAYATDCTYDSNTYQPGSKIGSLVCQPDGTWKSDDQ